MITSINSNIYLSDEAHDKLIKLMKIPLRLYKVNIINIRLSDICMYVTYSTNESKEIKTSTIPITITSIKIVKGFESSIEESQIINATYIRSTIMKSYRFKLIETENKLLLL